MSQAISPVAQPTAPGHAINRKYSLASPNGARTAVGNAAPTSNPGAQYAIALRHLREYANACHGNPISNETGADQDAAMRDKLTNSRAEIGPLIQGDNATIPVTTKDAIIGARTEANICGAVLGASRVTSLSPIIAHPLRATMKRQFIRVFQRVLRLHQRARGRFGPIREPRREEAQGRAAGEGGERFPFGG